MDNDNTQRLTVAVVGGGNVATHLLKMLAPHADTVAVNPRTLEGWRPDADVALLAVADDAVARVAARLEGFGGIVAHTSGSVPLSDLQAVARRPGVFYPLQTFSKARTPDYGRIPFFIEAACAADAQTLCNLARCVSGDVRRADSATRRRLHLASVLVCNFTNHLVALAGELLAADGLDASALTPLLHETVDKLDTLAPRQAQTGPAVRGDRGTVERHMEMLVAEPQLQELYRRLSLSINPDIFDTK